MWLIPGAHGSFLLSAKEKSLTLKTVVIDAGHGADDGGKLGINGAVEKDINLAKTR